MSESMVERVEAVLFSEFANPPREGEDLTARCHRLARAAIEAMRLDLSEQSESSPTDIVDTGRIAWMEWEIAPDDFKRANAATVEAWNAMLTAALGKGD